MVEREGDEGWRLREARDGKENKVKREGEGCRSCDRVGRREGVDHVTG